MAEHSSRTAVIAALVGNLLIALTKAIAATISGSSAMLSEAVHSVVDSGNEILLLYGQHRAAKPPDRLHPLGYGREIYFWSFVVALLIFAFGAGVSIYEGVKHIQHPAEMSDPAVNFAVYAISAVFEGISWWFGWSAFQRVRGDKALFAAVHASKDPPSFMVLFEDSAALVGLAIAGTATGLSLHFGAPWIDGAGSILIGIVLGTVAVLLARESKDLLIGERARPELSEAIRDAVSSLGRCNPRTVRAVALAGGLDGCYRPLTRRATVAGDTQLDLLGRCCGLVSSLRSRGRCRGGACAVEHRLDAARRQHPARSLHHGAELLRRGRRPSNRL